MKLYIFDDKGQCEAGVLPLDDGLIEHAAAAVGDFVAKYVIQRIKEFSPTPEKPFVIGLPTGELISRYTSCYQ